MNLFRLSRSFLALAVFSTVVSTTFATSTGGAAKAPKFDSSVIQIPGAVKTTFRQQASGGRIMGIKPMGLYYIGSVTKRDGQTVDLRVRSDGTIRSMK
jgi:hypothetical protein